MTTTTRNMTRSAILLALFAFIGTTILSLTYEATEEQIEQNERDALLGSLHTIIKPGSHDNDIFNDTMQVTDPELLGADEPVTVYIARKQGRPVAAVFTTIARNGYNGQIKMLVGVARDGTLTGVRVINHKETPGLGDAIEEQRSKWILGFDGKSLDEPPGKMWRVKKDGGYFDQFTGATITPRAVVKAVHNTLLYFRSHNKSLFAEDTGADNE